MPTPFEARPPALQLSRYAEGTVLFTPDVKRRPRIEVAVSLGPEDEQVATGSTDRSGRFRIKVPEAGPLWFRFGAGAHHRTPTLQPWTRGPIRLARYATDGFAPPRGSQILTGAVRRADGGGVVAMRVHLVEHSLERCQLVGIAHTQSDGAFSVSYDPAKLLQGEAPDLRVVLLDAWGKPIWETGERDVRLPADAVAFPARLELLLTELRSVRGGGSPRDLSDDDIDYLAAVRGFDRRWLTTLRRASQIAHEHSVGTSTAFALLAKTRAGDTPVAVVGNAVREGLVSASALASSETLDQLIRSFDEADAKTSPLFGILARAIPDQAQRADFVARLGREGHVDGFWEKLADGAALGENVRAVRFLVEASQLVWHEPAVMKVLESERRRSRIDDVSELGSWDDARWNGLVKQIPGTLPALFQESDETASRAAYAKHLRRMFEARFPNEALRGYLERRADVLPWESELRDFLRRHPNIDASLATSELEKQVPELAADSARDARAGLRVIERLRHVTSQLNAVGALIRANLPSAASITKGYNRHSFVDAFANAFGGKLHAANAYDSAVRIGELARWTHAIHARSFERTRLAATHDARFTIEARIEAEDAGTAQPVMFRNSSVTGPDLGVLRKIFGTDDLAFCECASCKSVFGPAAYLFDMLVFLRRFSTAAWQSSLLERLLERRPEIPTLPLTCDNTNTELPQVDLIIELLEGLVAPRIGLASPVTTGPCGGRSTSGTSAGRRAAPEHPADPDVVKAVRDAIRTWKLPYDRDRDLTARALATLQIDGNLVAIRQADLAQALNTGTSPLLLWLAERALGIGRTEWHLLKTVTTNVALAWGDAVATGGPPSVAEILSASGMTYSELFATLGARYVRAAISPTQPPISIEPPGCDVKRRRLVVPQRRLAAVLDRIHRFTRLRIKLGWPVDVLDDALELFGNGRPGWRDELLVCVGIAKYLQTAWSLTPDEVLLLVANPRFEPLDRYDTSGERPREGFARLFGPEPVAELPPNSASDDEKRLAVLASVARRSGVAQVDVHVLLDDKRFGLDQPFDDALAVADAANPTEAWQAAVAGAYRFRRLAEGTSMPLTALSALADLFSLSPWFVPASSPNAIARMFDLARLYLALDEARAWPLDPSTVRGICRGGTAAREHFLPANEVLGGLWRTIAAAIREDAPPLDAEGGPVEALRTALRAVLGDAANELQPGGTESTLERATRQIVWSVFYPAAADLVPAQPAQGAVRVLGNLLPPGALIAGDVAPVPPSDLAERPALKSALKQGIDAAVHEVLGRSFGAQAATASAVALAALKTELATWIEEPSLADVPVKAVELAATLTSPPGDSVALEVAVALVDRVKEVVRTTVQTLLDRTAARWLPAIVTCARRLAAEQAVVRAIAAAASVEEGVADALLRHLLPSPSVATEPLIRMFVPRGLDAAPRHLGVVTATYQSLHFFSSGAAPVPFGPVRVVEESSLDLDWAAKAPPPDIDPVCFRVKLATKIDAASLQGGVPWALQIQSTGRVQFTIASDPDVNLDGAGVIGEWNYTPTTLPASGPVAIEVELDAPAPVPNPSDPQPMPLRFRLEVVGRPARTGACVDAFAMFTKAARVVGAFPWQMQVWTIFQARGISLAALPLADSDPSWFATWRRLVRFAAISERSEPARSARFVASVLDGVEIPNDVARGALGLSSGEHDALFDLLHVPKTPDTVTLPKSEHALSAALALADLARQSGLPLKTLASWTAVPAITIFDQATGALKSRLRNDQWLAALSAIHDPVRMSYRDALVEWLLGAPLVKGATVHPQFANVNAISRHLFTDVLFDDCKITTRVQFAMAAVQSYVRAIRSGHEPGPSGPETGWQREALEGEWKWRQLYRLWEANRRVFVFPENFLDPDLRPDKTELFRALEDDIDSAELTDDTASRALAGYLSKLVDIARLEPVAIVEYPTGNVSSFAPTEPSLRGVHVFARTRSTPHELYYRRRYPAPDLRWTPWERVPVELQGDQFVAVVAFGRVYLFGFVVGVHQKKQAAPAGVGTCETPTDASAARATMQVGLSWIERRHGKWEGPRKSRRIELDIHDRAEAFRSKPKWKSDFPKDDFPVVEDEVSELSLSFEIGTKAVVPAHYTDLGDEYPPPPSKQAVRDISSVASNRALQGTESELRLEVWTTSGAKIYDDDIKRTGEPGWSVPQTTSISLHPPVRAGSLSAIRLIANGQPYGPYHMHRDVKESPIIWSSRDAFTLKGLRVQYTPAGGPVVDIGPTSDMFPREFFAWWTWPGPKEYWIQHYHDFSLNVPPPLGVSVGDFDIQPPSPAGGRTCTLEAGEGSAGIEFQLSPDRLDFSIKLNRACVRVTRRRRYRYNGDNPRPGWPTGWVDGIEQKECYELGNEYFAALTFLPDGSTEITPLDGRGYGHGDLTQVGQRFEGENEFEVYGGNAFNNAPNPFGVTVSPSDIDITSEPKLFDELKLADDPPELTRVLRTFFVERREDSFAVDNHDYSWRDVADVGPCLARLGEILASESVDRQDMWPDPLEVLGRLAAAIQPEPMRLGRSPIRTTPVIARGNRGVRARPARPMPANGGTVFDKKSAAINGAIAECRGHLRPGGARLLHAMAPALARSLTVMKAGEAWKSAASFAFASLSTATKKKPLRWWFQAFYHPLAPAFLRLINAYDAERLLELDTQTLAPKLFGDDLAHERARKSFFYPGYYPNGNVVHRDWPQDIVDFSLTGAYADYNFEIFLHAPWLIAERLSQAGRFEDAEKWFRTIFDCGRARLATDPLDSFRTLPLNKYQSKRLDELLLVTSDPAVRAELEAQIDRLNRFPFQPHLIARIRLGAYQRALVMSYLDHLFAWADDLFRKAYALDQSTFLDAASEKYAEIADILGPRPELLPEMGPSGAFCYNSVVTNQSDLDLWDPIVELEHVLQPSGLVPAQTSGGNGIPELLFCIPHNEVLLEYWDRLADRLLKLRGCQDIEGVERVLSLYGRVIDPGLLVRATAMGLDIDVVLGNLAAPLPRFRFQVMIQRAREVCADAKSLGQNLLAAIEKKEAEDLARVRSSHELALLKGARTVREHQKLEAKESRVALEKSREAADERRRFYQSRERQSGLELAEGKALGDAARSDSSAAGAARAAAEWALYPDFVTTVTVGVDWRAPYLITTLTGALSYGIGGTLASRIAQMNASGHQRDATVRRTEAARVGRQAQFDRRWEEWQLQGRLAVRDIAQIDRQIASAEIREAIAELELENQEKQIENAEVVNAYLQNKFTRTELYRWMEKRLTRLYQQQYRLAFELAQKAQRALAYELGLETPVGLDDPWDSAHQGLCAADELMRSLDLMQHSYVEQSRRDHEKRKDFSLFERRPLELLELREKDSCVFQIFEHDLDEDEPGDWFRRIKSVSVTIPCVHGPSVSVNARLTLLRSELRVKPFRGGSATEYPRRNNAADDRFRDDPGGLDHIVTSSGVRDAGLFEVNLRDERWLPFEGAGVISTWRLELPKGTNRFDRRSVTDAVLHILYTSRDGGRHAAEMASEAREARLASEGVVFALESGSFFDDFVRFAAPLGMVERKIELKLGSEHLPYDAKKASKLKEAMLVLDVDGNVERLAATPAPILPDPITGMRMIDLGSITIPSATTLRLRCNPARAMWLCART